MTATRARHLPVLIQITHSHGTSLSVPSMAPPHRGPGLVYRTYHCRAGGFYIRARHKSPNHRDTPTLHLLCAADVDLGMKVVVAVDDSEGSHRALAWVLDHLFPAAAAEPHEAPELALVHALEPLHCVMYPVGPGSAVYGAPSMMESVRAAQKENARNLLDRAKRICDQRGVSAEAVVVDGEPKEAVCRAAEDLGAGLLVVGSRGLGAIKRAFLGSVSDYCAHHASCPIMVVKPSPHDRDG